MKRASNVWLLNKTIYLAFVVLSIGVTACKEQKPGAAVQSPGMREISLMPQGLFITLQIPDSTRGKLEVSNENDGTTHVQVGKNFHISIYEGAEANRMELERGDIMGNEVNKFKRFLIDEPNTILYESEIVAPEYHFFTIVSAGDKTYVVQDAKDEKFSEDAIRKMLESAKSIKPVEAANPAS